MGYIAHDAVIVTTVEHRPGGLPDIDVFRQSLPPEFRPLILGPIAAPLNDYVSYVFLPDGSKEGWPPSDRGDEYREQFKILFRQRYEDGSSHDDWVHIRYGGDFSREVGARIESEHPDRSQR